MPRANLNKARIVEAAAHLANERGFAALSLKDIAAHFNVKPPSLFKHIRDLAEIKDALAVSGLKKLRDMVTGARGKNATEQLAAVLHAYRNFAKTFPGEYDAFQETHVLRSPEVYKLGEEVLWVFAEVLPERMGYTAKIHALRFMRSAVHGFVTLENSGGFGLAEDIDESFRLMVERLVSLVAAAPV